ncbi:MAG TPA: Wzz/FepE/Etk N-terminal domain-containing protein, partial [Steroidobacteraceae bacterium]|nr:Wzz/FepE/Etk N-terminal domain-containing protein [Steroidobacteraceae bacterium]
MRFSQLLRILRAHIGLIFIAVVGAWVVGGAITAAMTPRYVATSSVLINFADGTDAAGKPPAQLYSGYLATQIDVLGSQNVALKVVDRLNLVDDAAACQRFLGTESSMEETLRRAKDTVIGLVQRFMPERRVDADETSDAGNERYRIADRFMKNSVVRPSPDSSVIQVGYSAPTARTA